jgi:Flp pilus assembly pilin Flp
VGALRTLVRARKDETGQAGVEYGLILALVTIGAVVGVILLSGGVDNLFDKVDLNGATPSETPPPRVSPPPLRDGAELSGQGIPSGTVWFNVGAVTRNGQPAPPGAYTNAAPGGGSCSFSADGFSFTGRWTEQTFVGPGGTTYRYACVAG